jgi:hypothetical protein
VEYPPGHDEVRVCEPAAARLANGATGFVDLGPALRLAELVPGDVPEAVPAAHSVLLE